MSTRYSGAAAALAILCGAGCVQQDFLLVTLDGVPPQTTRLLVRSTLAGRDALAPEVFELGAGQQVQRPSFALRIPARGRGWLAISVEAWADSCAVGWASTGVDWLNRHGVVRPELTVAALGKPSCDEGFALSPGMVPVPAGSYAMGCTPLEQGCQIDQQPLRSVNLSAFEIDRTEVSIGEYQDCVAAGDCAAPLASYLSDRRFQPQSYVSWELASRFCEAQGKALPTEAQWEAAARGPLGLPYPWGTDPPDCDRANFLPSDEDWETLCRPIGDKVAKVGSLPLGASPFGALEMSGNLSEWVSDWYANPDPTASLDDPTGPSSGSWKVLKGGSWLHYAIGIRAAVRFGNLPDGSTDDGSLDPATNTSTMGFRCARSR